MTPIVMRPMIPMRGSRMTSNLKRKAKNRTKARFEDLHIV